MAAKKAKKIPKKDKHKPPKVAIIVPFIAMDKFVKECIDSCLDLDYSNFELILLPDFPLEQKFKDKRIKVIPTGAVHPSEKRNIAIFSKNLDFDIGASIDSDAYPRIDWLRKAVTILEKDRKVAIVGGPNAKPHDARIRERVAIDIVHSRLGVGGAYYISRYGKISQVVKEVPSSNLVFRRNDLRLINGYSSIYKTGEDTLLCYNVRRLGKMIIFSEDVIVYHHRRPLFGKHLSRVYQQAVDKVLILKKKMTFSKLIYFIPAGFVLALITLIILSFFNMIFLKLLIGILGIYFALAFVEASTKDEFAGIPLFMLGVFLTHITYGIGFVKGILFGK